MLERVEKKINAIATKKHLNDDAKIDLKAIRELVAREREVPQPAPAAAPEVKEDPSVLAVQSRSSETKPARKRKSEAERLKEDNERFAAWEKAAAIRKQSQK
jgi:hypothetical protein